MAAHILPHALTVAAALPPFPPIHFHENKPYSEWRRRRRRRRFNRHDGTSVMGRRRSIGDKNKNVTVGKVGSQIVAALSKDEVELSFEICLDEQLPKYPEIMEILGTAARHAEERGHKLIDQIRTLMIRGLLHLLRFDDELSDEEREEMEKEEKIISGGLGWKGKGSALSAYDTEPNGTPHSDSRDAQITFIHRNRSEGGLRFHKPKFSYIFCDMDGTLLNSKSQISTATAAALKEVSSRGVKVVIATGKTRAAVMNIFKMANLAGKDGIVSEFSPGVFVQGLQVHGKQGREIYRRSLDASICREAFLYSLNHKIPIVAFSDNRCLTLFGHPLLDSLETLYHEPKPEIIPSVEQLLAGFEIQKLILLDSVNGVATTLRPYWEEATKDSASVVQAVPDILEIVPLGTSKGNDVRILLDHLGVSPSEIMAIGDGENDVEMLDLASLGVALSNGSEKAKAIANVIGLSNDEDGVADAIYRYAL